MAELAYIALAIILLFGAVIFLGLRSRRRFLAAASSEVLAGDLWPRYGDDRWQRADLIYGVPADFSMTRAGWIVKDHQDKVLGHIAGTILGVEITVSDQTYRIVRQSQGLARSSIVLYEVGASATPVEVFSLRSIGLFGALGGRYLSRQLGTFVLKKPISLLSQGPYPILVNGVVTGQAGVVGALRPMAKVLVYPSSVLIAIRMLFLWLS